MEQGILYGGPEQTDFIGDAQSLGEFIIDKLKKIGNEVIYIDGISNEKLTGYQLLQRSVCVAEWLIENGVRKGDRILIISDNRFEFIYVAFGVLFIGAVVCPVNHAYTEREIQHAINLSRPNIIFSIPTVIGRIGNIIDRFNKSNIKIVILNQHVENADHLGLPISIDQILKNVTSHYRKFKSPPTNLKETSAFIMCSSGTTDLPKGVELTQANGLVGIWQLFDRSSLISRRVLLSVVPWTHVMGCIGMIGTVAVPEGKLIFLPKFEGDTFLKAIEVNEVNVLYIVPPLMIFLAKSPLIDKYNIKCVELIACGAAPLGSEVIDAVLKRLPHIKKIREGYGMSECTLAVTSQNDEYHKIGSVGVLRKGIWGKVINLETGRTLGPNETGELLFKGSVVMKGYVGDDTATKNIIDSDGWLHTGDVGYYNEDGEWFVVDRLKELIKYKGHQVPPAELENILCSHTDVLDAGVIGIPDEMAGELPLAFVVRRPGCNISEQDIKQFVATQVSPQKQLRGGVRFVSEIPKSPSGKILRRELRQIAKESIMSKL